MNKNIDGEHKRVSRIAIACAIGTIIEWYDFFLYGVLAALVLNHVFFPNYSPFIGMMLSYTTFAVGFLARPIGGIIFGHFGDRLGRKKILVLTLLIMGISTTLIGLLPGYDRIGIMAPIILLGLRVMQGIGIGGEWGGAVVLAIEHAPKQKRSFYGSYPQIGGPAGLMVSTAVVAILNQMPTADFMAWGWRCAFLLSSLLVVIGLIIRLKITETPEFTNLKAHGHEVSVPFFEMFKTYRKEVLKTLGARFIEGASFNIFGVFIISYGVSTLHLSRGFILNGVILGSGLIIPFIFIFGALADKFGLRQVFGIGSLFLGVTTAISLFIMQTYGTQHPWVVWLAIIIPLSIGVPMVYGPEASLFATQFDARVRYTGVSFAYQFSGIFASGLTPIIATLLVQKAGGKPWLVIGYMAIISLISFISVLTMKIPNPKVVLADMRTQSGLNTETVQTNNLEEIIPTS